MDLPQEITQKIDLEIAKYPKGRQQSAVMAALTIVQDHNGGYLTDELMQSVAHYLEMPVISVKEVATFYSMYDLDPVGRHKLYVCTNLSCRLKDCAKLEEYLKKKLNVDFGETTPDGKFTLKSAECLGACVEAPVMHIGDHYHGHLTEEKIDQILDELE